MLYRLWTEKNEHIITSVLSCVEEYRKITEEGKT